VARDAKYESLDEAPRPFLYTPLAQDWVGFMAIIADTAGNPADFTTPLRDILRELDPELRIYEIRTLEQYAAESLWKTRWQAMLLAVFGGLAVTRLMVRLLLGLSPLDPVSFAAASLAWLAIAMLAAYVPARRATRVDPVAALRWE
jgi:hypothetical protein